MPLRTGSWRCHKMAAIGVGANHKMLHAKHPPMMEAAISEWVLATDQQDNTSWDFLKRFLFQ